MTCLIFNGGDPLKGCPTSYAEAEAWAAEANSGHEEWQAPMWSWDCGFKLDYDGPLLRLSSRFYPPKTHYGDKWDGSVTVLVLGTEVMKKEFECETLEELRMQVSAFQKELVTKLMETFSPNLATADHGECND